MRRIILFTVFLCCGTVVVAQDTLNFQNTLRFNFYYALPTGDFNRTAFEDEYPDFARNGILLSVSYLKKVHQYASLGGSVLYRSNQFKLGEFASRNDYIVLKRESEAWKSAALLADVYLQTPEGRSGSLYLKGSAGPSFNRSAYVNILTSYGTIELPADNDIAFAWGYGAGLQTSYNGWGFMLEVSQLNSTSTFSGRDPQGKTLEYKQPMTSVNIGMGASYSF